MSPGSPSVTVEEVAAFRGTTIEILEALAETFRPLRLWAALLGLAVTFVVALGFGAYAGSLFVRNLVPQAAMLGILAGLVAYLGLLLTFGALCRMAAAERQGEEITASAAFGFAFSHSHIIVGLPFFTMLVALGVGLLGTRIGFDAGATRGLNSGLAALLVLLLFALDLFLILAVLVSHALAAPCAACTQEPFSAIGSRLVQLFHEDLHRFVAHQAAVLLGALPILALTAGLLFGAFQPAFYSVTSGRLAAQSRQKVAPRPLGAPATEQPAPAEGDSGMSGGFRRWLDTTAQAGGGALVGVAALVLLLLGVCPLTYAAAAETAVYLGLTGFNVATVEEVRPESERPATATEPAAEKKHPPIVHCWRCDAINRYDEDFCAKCGAEYTVCPHCFATNEVGREDCTTCGKPLKTRKVAAAQPTTGAEG